MNVNMLNESVLENQKFIPPHMFGLEVARKSKMMDLAYKWEDPPSATRLSTKVQFEKRVIYFAVKKATSPKLYRYYLKSGKMGYSEAKGEVTQIINAALMIRHQDTEALEAYLRGKKPAQLRVIFLEKIIFNE